MKKSTWSVFMVVIIVSAVLMIGGLLLTEVKSNQDALALQEMDAYSPLASMPAVDSGILIEQVQTFSGLLPCADCPGVQTTLQITSGSPETGFGTFNLTENYLERDVQPMVTSGDWIMMFGTDEDPQAQVFLLLPTGGDQVIFYERISDNTLKLLDLNGNVITSDLNYNLNKVN